MPKKITARTAEGFLFDRATALGMDEVQVKAERDDLGMANLNLFFRETPQAYGCMAQLERDLRKRLQDDVRSGYYQREGSADPESIPEGKAMMQFDCFFLDFGKGN